jgi:TRAF3-interacting protein 1
LRKPPFRFLHDIVSELSKVTGFADGLYDENELNSGTIKVEASRATLARLTRL